MEKPEELDNVVLEQYRQLANQQINQSQMQQAISNVWANALGGALGGMGSGMSTAPQDWQQAYTTTFNPMPYQMPPSPSDYGARVRFNRINETIEINRKDKFTNDGEKLEPLDELRIKVADWLNN